MNSLNCDCRCRCTTAAIISSAIIGIIAAFLQITGLIAISTGFLWVVFGIAVLYLGVLILSAALARGAEACDCLCPNLRVLLCGILGTILLALILLLIDIASATVIGAILVGLLLFFFALLLTSSACLVRCLSRCDS